MAHVATVTGWTWEQVEAMRIPNLMALVEWWKKHPPMAYAAGGGGKDGAPPDSDDEKKLDGDELVGLLTGGQ